MLLTTFNWRSDVALLSLWFCVVSLYKTIYLLLLFTAAILKIIPGFHITILSACCTPSGAPTSTILNYITLLFLIWPSLALQLASMTLFAGNVTSFPLILTSGCSIITYVFWIKFTMSSMSLVDVWNSFINDFLPRNIYANAFIALVNILHFTLSSPPIH